MAKITLKGNAIQTSGNLPSLGDIAKDFSLTANDLTEKTLNDYSGKKKVLNIFPSVDTGICAASVRRFNQEASSLSNTIVLNISKDLPFAQKRFCGAEGIEKAETLSAFRSSFSTDYNLEITESGMRGLCSRAIIILDENNKVLYTEQVSEIVQEPNYESALNVLLQTA
jgi:thioredoxin-dependent peroxiredoxin